MANSTLSHKIFFYTHENLALRILTNKNLQTLQNNGYFVFQVEKLNNYTPSCSSTFIIGFDKRKPSFFNIYNHIYNLQK